MGVLRRLFGPSRKEIWTQLSGEIGGRYLDGGFRKGDRVEATHGEWTVTLDTYAVSTGKVTVVRELVAAQPHIRFEVKDDEGWFGPSFPEGVDELQFVVGGVIKDVERLKLLYELFAETLEQLCRIGAAYESAPDVAL